MKEISALVILLAIALPVAACAAPDAETPDTTTPPPFLQPESMPIVEEEISSVIEIPSVTLGNKSLSADSLGKWEYKTILVDYPGGASSFREAVELVAEQLNVYGADGWELVSFSNSPTGGSTSIAVFKRQLP